MDSTLTDRIAQQIGQLIINLTMAGIQAEQLHAQNMEQAKRLHEFEQGNAELQSALDELKATVASAKVDRPTD